MRSGDPRGDYELQGSVGEILSGGSKGEFGHDPRRRGGEEGAGGAARAGHSEEINRDGMFVQPPKYFTRMTWTRILMFPFSLLVFGLTAVTWVGYNEQTDAAPWVEKAVFNVELLFMLMSYFQVMLLDPGGIPKRWHSKIAASPGLRDRFRLCRKTNVYKPPRANFDHITNSQVLNFDHFCPWMVNAIGFYNRKFFVLFLFWCLVCCVHFTLAMLIHGDWTARGLVRSPKGELTITKFVAVALDAAMSIGVALFLGVHVKFVIYNQTTMEPCETRYDLGWRKNVESVFGRNPWLWLLPVYGAGPVGDGVTWPEGKSKEDRLEEGGRGRGDGEYESESGQEFEDAVDEGSSQEGD